jgi:hypothetical protein
LLAYLEYDISKCWHRNNNSVKIKQKSINKKDENLKYLNNVNKQFFLKSLNLKYYMILRDGPFNLKRGVMFLYFRFSSFLFIDFCLILTELLFYI